MVFLHYILMKVIISGRQCMYLQALVLRKVLIMIRLPLTTSRILTLILVNYSWLNIRWCIRVFEHRKSWAF